MSITSTVPTSRRGYLSQSELEQYSNIIVSDTDEADDVISQAEEIIDTYVGFQKKAIRIEIAGKAVLSTSDTLTLQNDQQNIYEIDYLKLCEIEILGGTGAGQRRKITGQTKDGVITVDTDWVIAPDATSFYKIYQLGKFPRLEDSHLYSTTSPSQYYKSIPEEVKRATAAQVQYIIEMGDKFFSSDKSEKTEEKIADYSYAKSAGASNDRLIAPKAKILLKHIRCRVGSL